MLSYNRIILKNLIRYKIDLKMAQIKEKEKQDM